MLKIDSFQTKINQVINFSNHLAKDSYRTFSTIIKEKLGNASISCSNTLSNIRKISENISLYCEKNKFVAGFATGSILTTIFIVAMSQLNQFATGLTSIIVLSLIAKLAVDLFREKQKTKNLNEKLISQNIDFEEITESLNSIQNNIERLLIFKRNCGNG